MRIPTPLIAIAAVVTMLSATPAGALPTEAGPAKAFISSAASGEPIIRSEEHTS